MNAGVVLQEPRNFTVQVVRRDEAERALGTGVVIAAEGIVATCRHVLVPAGQALTDTVMRRVGVRFPQWAGRPASVHAVTVCAQSEDHDDDLVCMRLLDPPLLDERQVATLGDAEFSTGHPFRSYGYRRLAGYQAARASGMIVGTVEAPAGKRLHAEPVQLRSPDIDQGMSGAGVLDERRNLLVGLVAETWYASASGKDRDTGWALNARVVDLSGLGVPIRHDNLPLAQSPVPKAAGALPRPHTSSHIQLDQAPAPITEWVGRSGIVEDLAGQWNADDGHLVIGLIGFGGEGKTSVARRVVDTVLDQPRRADFGGVFWWTFYDTAGPDEFLTAALEFLSQNPVLAASVQGAARAEVAASMLAQRRYLFVLDGLESFQHQRGDGYGALTNQALLTFLRYFAAPGHRSRCLITSRAPVFDLLPYVTYEHIDLEALDPSAARELLRKLGVIGSDAALDQVVADWGRHALTLRLLAAYLVRRYRGDVRRVSTLPRPDPAERRDDMVARVLRQYDACLDPEEREFLVAFSVYRTPVDRSAFAALLPHATAEWAVEPFDHLLGTRIIQLDQSGRARMHPLVRDHYSTAGRQEPVAWQALHRAAKHYYLGLMRPDSPRLTLEDLSPAIEAAHHACMAGEFAEASDIVYDQLYDGERGLITRELNAYSTVLSVFQDFFPDQQLHRRPLADDPDTRSWIYHETATALQMLGRLREAAMLHRRAIDDFASLELWHDAAVSCQNLTELHLDLGALGSARELISRAFDLAERAGDPEDELVAHTLSGGLAHLEGRTGDADHAFAEALRLAKTHTPLPILYSTSGLHYAEHLRRKGLTAQALAVHRANLRTCRRAGWQADEARCHIGLGDLALDRGDLDAADSEYNRAYDIARHITRRDTLIHAVLGRSRATARASAADLDQALTLALEGGYRILEIDIRVLMASRNAEQDPAAAWEMASHADQLANDIGYHWGRVDADVVLRSLA